MRARQRLSYQGCWIACGARALRWSMLHSGPASYLSAVLISTSALDALKDYSNGYLEKLFGDTWFQIKGEINLGMLGAKTPQDVAKAIGMTIDKGKFANIALRAETITQTEMGRIFSTATQSLYGRGCGVCRRD